MLAFEDLNIQHPVPAAMPTICYYVSCGGLNDSDPHRLIYLSTCFPIGRTVWEELRSAILLEEVCYQVVDFKVLKAHDISSLLSLPPTCGSRCQL